MTEVKVYFKLEKVMEVVYQLRAEGLVQGIDFDFTYVPVRQSFLTETNEKTHCIFSFSDGSRAMLMALQYGN